MHLRGVRPLPGVCARRDVRDDIHTLRVSLHKEPDDVIISVAELLSFVSFAAERGPWWKDKLVLVFESEQSFS